MSEHQIQAMLCNWLETNHPNVLFFAIPNGASLSNPRQMSILKSEGLLPGVSDLLICEPRGKWHGCFCELKTETGVLSEGQKWFLAQVEERSYYTVVARGYEQAVEMIGYYLSWTD